MYTYNKILKIKIKKTREIDRLESYYLYFARALARTYTHSNGCSEVPGTFTVEKDIEINQY